MSRRNRGIVIAAASVLALIVVAYGGLAFSVSDLIDAGVASCGACWEENDGPNGDLSRCLTQRAFLVARLVPWAREELEPAERRCRERVIQRGLLNATYLTPNRAARDRWLERAEDLPPELLYEAGAYDRVVEAPIEDEWLTRAQIGAALHLRSLDAVRRVAMRPAAVPDQPWLDARKGAWLCLLGEEEEGRRLIQATVAYRQALPEATRHALPSQLLLYACGGPPPTDPSRRFADEASAEEQHLALALGDRAPEAVLARVELPIGLRRYALALALRDADDLPLSRTLGWLRATAEPEGGRLCARSEVLDGAALPIDPDAAASAADRLLTWLDSRAEELHALEARLPPRYELGPLPEDEDEPADEVPVRVDLVAYVRRVAADLRFDAALAYYARGVHSRGLELFRGARELAPRDCPSAFVLSGEVPPEPHPIGDAQEDAVARATWLTAHGRDADAYAVLEGALRPAWSGDPDHWRWAALGVALGRPAPEPPRIEEMGEMGEESIAWTSWRDARSGNGAAHRLTARDGAGSAGSWTTYSLPPLTREAAVSVTASFARGFDEDVYIDALYAGWIARSGIWWRFRRASARGDTEEATRWRSFYEELAGLASTPPRALLLAAAFGERTPEPDQDYLLRTTDEPPAEWGPLTVWTSECAEGLWALVPGHVPARDDAELAHRWLERERFATEARARTFVVVYNVALDTETGLAWLPVQLECDAGWSDWSESVRAPDDATLDAIADGDEEFWWTHFVANGETLRLGVGDTRVETRRGVRVRVAPPPLFIRIPDARLARLSDRQIRTVEAAYRVRAVEVDRGAGPWFTGELVGARLIVEDVGVVYDSRVDGPPVPRPSEP